MAVAIIFGGSGYIGTKLAQHLLDSGFCSYLYIADIQESSLKNHEKVSFHYVDVRRPISTDIIKHPIDYIFNLAAIHREPGHQAEEYFHTNIQGAYHVTRFASKIGCTHIIFTSSISVYGHTKQATDEQALTMPDTPYGMSKLTAEYIHKDWLHTNHLHRLIIIRPGVIFGPQDPGNILRMIRAIKKGYFFLPVSPDIKKSYGYIYGLIDSIYFTLDKSADFPLQIYNYVEKETESLGIMLQTIGNTFSWKVKIIRLPFLWLYIAAKIARHLPFVPQSIHPTRVKKLTRPTHIVPYYLINQGFLFRYDFRTALEHWRHIAPSDFE